MSPNRAQSILYGQTYQSFLFCEQIGLALIEKTKASPQLFIGDSMPLLALNELTEVPTVVLDSEVMDQQLSTGPLSENRIADQSTGSLQSTQPNYSKQPSSFIANHRTLWTMARDAAERSLIQKLAGGFTATLPWEEPFERIRTAIEEAHAVAR